MFSTVQAQQQAQQAKTITLEAFEAQLRGTSVLWYLASKATSQTTYSPQYPPGFIDQVVTDAAPFQKKCLVISPQTPPGWRLIDDFDIIFRPVTTVDWSLLLTFLTNSAKPLLCILAPYVYPPAQLLQKLPTSITLVSLVFMDEPSTNLHVGAYQSILLPPLSLDVIPTISFPQHLGISNPTWNIITVLRDLHGAGASLVVSSAERQVQKQFYWFYTSNNQQHTWSLQQTQSILSALTV
jgi:hypothetical protein